MDVAASFVDENSCMCFKSELDLFYVPPTQTSMESGGYVEYNPISNVDDGAPVEFDIGGSGSDYIDIANTQLYVKVKIQNADGTVLGDSAAVGPVNNLLHSLFSDVEVKLNGTVVSMSNSTYAYRAYLENVLSYGTDAKSSQLQAPLYYKDTAGYMEANKLTGEGNDAKNIGLKKRAALFSKSAEVELMGRIHSDMFMQAKYLPGDVNVRLRFVRNKDAFCLMGDANSTYKLKITECKLFIRKVKMSKNLYNAQNYTMVNNNVRAKYPLRRIVCKTFTVSTGTLNFTQEKVFTGQLPVRLVVACVDNSSFNGQYDKNPFNFKHYSMTEMKVYIDGQQHPLKPLKMNYDNDQYLMGYMSMFSGTGKMYRDEGTDIMRSDYPKGYAIYAFDLTPDMGDDDHVNLIKEGSVRLDITFANPLPHTINVIAYGEFENVLEIDSARNVMFDYGN